MKFLTATIKPFRLANVRDELSKIGINGLTATEVRGFGRQKGHTELYRGIEYVVDFIPKTRIEIALEDHRVDEVVEVITRVARTGKTGDGKIFIQDLAQVYRIRTGETGGEAL